MYLGLPKGLAAHEQANLNHHSVHACSGFRAVFHFWKACRTCIDVFLQPIHIEACNRGLMGSIRTATTQCQGMLVACGLLQKRRACSASRQLLVNFEILCSCTITLTVQLVELHIHCPWAPIVGRQLTAASGSSMHI